jgi:hypothetical protein
MTAARGVQRRRGAPCRPLSHRSRCWAGAGPGAPPGRPDGAGEPAAASMGDIWCSGLSRAGRLAQRRLVFRSPSRLVLMATSLLFEPSDRCPAGGLPGGSGRTLEGSSPGCDRPRQRAGCGRRSQIGSKYPRNDAGSRHRRGGLGWIRRGPPHPHRGPTVRNPLTEVWSTRARSVGGTMQQMMSARARCDRCPALHRGCAAPPQVSRLTARRSCWAAPRTGLVEAPADHPTMDRTAADRPSVSHPVVWRHPLTSQPAAGGREAVTPHGVHGLHRPLVKRRPSARSRAVTTLWARPATPAARCLSSLLGLHRQLDSCPMASGPAGRNGTGDGTGPAGP